MWMLLLLLTICLGCANASSSSSSSVAGPDKFDFQFAAEELITPLLKAPATAAYAPHADWVFDQIDKTTWRMQGWVDAENAFSAFIRNRFTVIVSSTAGGWQLRYLKFDESDDKFGTYLFTPEEQRARDLAAKTAAESERAAVAEARRQQKKLWAAEAAAESAARDKMRAQLDDLRRRSRELRERQQDEEYLEQINRQTKRELEQKRLAAIEDAKFRTWSSAGGKFAVDAKIVSYGNGQVTLENRTGKRIKVPLERLSDSDRAFVDKWRDERL